MVFPNVLTHEALKAAPVMDFFHNLNVQEAIPGL
jgi:hypothetical protein